MSFGHIVLANSKKGIVPAIIRFFTRSKFSHSLITTASLHGAPMCLEAAGSGVNALRFDLGYIENPTQEFIIFHVCLPDLTKDKALRSVLAQLEVQYGALELLWFMWRAINRWIGRDIKSQNNWVKSGIICSELCRMYLTECGLGELFKDFGEGSLNAEDLYQIILANPNLFQLIPNSRN